MSDLENKPEPNKPGNPNFIEGSDYPRDAGKYGASKRWFEEKHQKQAEQAASTESAASFIKSLFSK